MKPQNRPMSPRIYVACLASYNAGKLHGTWIDATEPEDVIQSKIDGMLETSPEAPAEEWAVHDSEGLDPWNHGEYPDLETVSQVANALDERGDAFRAALENYSDVDKALFALENRYRGEWDSLTEWAEEYLEGTGLLGEVPKELRGYIDVESYGRDLELGGDVQSIRINGRVHVFDM